MVNTSILNVFAIDIKSAIATCQVIISDAQFQFCDGLDHVGPGVARMQEP